MATDRNPTDQITTAPWLRRLAIASTAATISVAVLGATGVLIESIFLSFYGLSGFDVLRARSILTGLAYFTFLLLPLASMGGAGVLAARMLGRWLRSPYSRFAVAFSVTLALWYILPIPLHYFVSGARSDNLFLASRAVMALYFGLPTYYLSFTLFWLPCTLFMQQFLLRHVDSLPFQFGWTSRILAAVAAIGWLTTPVPYALWVYPNIKLAMGGGQPYSAFILGDSTIDGLLAEMEQRNPQPLRQSFRPSEMRGPFLIWRHEGGVLYISEIPHVRLFNLTAIDRSRIVALRTLDADFLIRPRGPVYLPDASEVFWQLQDLTEEINELRKRASDLDEAKDQPESRSPKNDSSTATENKDGGG